jgi:3-deoxy-manno-octulosonate cytidylyltransferase (CMP-KDO synthetase)
MSAPPLVLIPARLAATRLPDKPLADIAGKPMVVRVLEIAWAAGFHDAAVAAGDREIVAAVEAAGGRAVLTDPALPSGTDRICAALASLDPDGRRDVVINLQGDVPTLPADDLRAVAAALAAQPQADIATLVAPCRPQERADPNTVKAVLSFGSDRTIGRALYFTRASAPWGEGVLWHHIGVYAYRRAALERFVCAPPSPLETREKLEQLRALELGMTICAAVTDAAPKGVDAPEDLALARAAFGVTGEMEPL